MSSKKEVLKSELCINKSKEKNKVVQKRDVPTPPQFHKSVQKLFEVVALIYKDRYNIAKREDYPIKRFKSAIALYFGFHERNVGPRFNLLESLGIIRVIEPSRTNRRGKVILNLEKLLEHYSDDDELWDIRSKKRKEESKWNMKN